ncbi:MAG TPA: patatin-like phospholipase family protein [Bryobacteraceae bacterium]|jgi:predicted acylesterase/phospholipase RssA
MALFDVVFEGGGAKGSAFAGALTALRAEGHSTRRLIGTSAGAITAALTAAGYTPEEMLDAVNEKQNGKPRFASFMDHPQASDFTQQQKDNSDTMRALQAVHLPVLAGHALLDVLLKAPLYPTLFSIVECGGVYAGMAFLKWLTEKLAAKGITATDTMATVFARTQVDLSVVTSDTTDMEMVVLNHRTAPGVPLAWAVRMSMSIPMVWREVVWDASWGPYCGRSKTGNVFVDGGVLSNFPIRLIAESVPEIMGNTDPNGALNLGLLLDETLGVPGVPAKPPMPINDLRVVQRLSRLMDTMMGAQDNAEMREHASEICRLPVQGYGTTEFDMQDAKLHALVEAGRNAMETHLRSRNLGRAAAT